mmetsp:Transcript_44162/g.86648  ORF Transcript_44162/g.86648 Transcript_44162/m.86648 type:complete len:222 (+) Transcript_44162:25-690(+)
MLQYGPPASDTSSCRRSRVCVCRNDNPCQHRHPCGRRIPRPSTISPNTPFTPDLRSDSTSSRAGSASPTSLPSSRAHTSATVSRSTSRRRRRSVSSACSRCRSPSSACRVAERKPSSISARWIRSGRVEKARVRERSCWDRTAWCQSSYCAWKSGGSKETAPPRAGGQMGSSGAGVGGTEPSGSRRGGEMRFASRRRSWVKRRMRRPLASTGSRPGKHPKG